MNALWIGHVTINTNPHSQAPQTRVYQSNDETITMPTNELRQLGPVDNGFRRLAGSFETEAAAQAAVIAYTSPHQPGMTQGMV